MGSVSEYTEGRPIVQELTSSDFILVDSSSAAESVSVKFGAIVTIGNMVAVNGQIELSEDDVVFIITPHVNKIKIGALVNRQEMNTTAEVIGGYGDITSGEYEGHNMIYINRDNNITGPCLVAFSFTYKIV